MKHLLIVLAAAMLAAPASAQQPKPMSLEQQLLLRCSAAFAIVASEQARGAPSVNAYPPLGERGREFFVRSSERLMEELQLSREDLAARMRAEVEWLQRNASAAEEASAYVDSVMRPCLAYLEASGL